MRLFFRPSGTSPLTMRCARPSTIAVLPTPGSPISTGLFLVRRCRTWIVRRISSSRPITGSSLPARARAVRSTVYFSSAWRFSSAPASCTFSPPRTSSMAFSTAACAARLLQRPRRAPAVLEGGEHEQLAGDVLVPALLRELVGHVEQPRRSLRAARPRRRPAPSAASTEARELAPSRRVHGPRPSAAAAARCRPAARASPAAGAPVR